MSDREPDWNGSDKWDEFEWEKAFKFSERMTSRYFQLLSRFGDLPDAESFIANQLGDTSFLYVDDDDLGNTGFQDKDSGWSLEKRPPDQEEVGPGHPFYYEVCPVFMKARQMALGWSNVLSSVLAPEDRYWGLRMLFYMGRILSYIAMSIGDGTFERIDGSIAFVKRVLHQINVALGELDEKLRAAPQYHGMFKVVRELLLETHDMVVSYLAELRERKGKGPYDDHDK